MFSTKTLFLCPAYKPSSLAQVETYRNNCDRIARRFRLEYEVLEASLADPQAGDWHRSLAQEYSHKIINSKFLWPIRGGFGCIYWADFWLKHQSQEAAEEIPRLIGYSDITVWHCIWHIQHWGETYYAFMPGADWGTLAEDSLERCLSGEAWSIGQVDFPEVQTLRNGSAEGPCFAACLRVLSGQAGTATQPDLRGHILALEDIDERPYAIERDMQQLARSGMLEGVVALVIGTMPFEIPEGYQGPSIVDIFTLWGEALQIPVIQALPFGHVKDPLSLPNGRMSTLQVDGHEWSWSFTVR